MNSMIHEQRSWLHWLYEVVVIGIILNIVLAPVLWTCMLVWIGWIAIRDVKLGMGPITRRIPAWPFLVSGAATLMWFVIFYGYGGA